MMIVIYGSQSDWLPQQIPPTVWIYKIALAICQVFHFKEVHLDVLLLPCSIMIIMDLK